MTWKRYPTFVIRSVAVHPQACTVNLLKRYLAGDGLPWQDTLSTHRYFGAFLWLSSSASTSPLWS
jgi:hypothetical protein